MGPHKILTLAVAERDIDGIAVIVDQAPGKGVLHLAVVDLIKVTLAPAVVARMEIKRHLPAAGHRDVVRELDVERAHQALAGDAALGADTDTEHVGVHTAVGARAALDVLAAAQHCLQRVLQHLRDGEGVFLHLKSMIVCPLIAYGQEKIALILHTGSFDLLLFVSLIFFYYSRIPAICHYCGAK